jgi:hypothetical protein
MMNPQARVATNVKVQDQKNVDLLQHQGYLTPWLWSASELCRPSDRRLSAKLVTTFADITYFKCLLEETAVSQTIYMEVLKKSLMDAVWRRR